MKLPRLQLFEHEDLPWFPETIRDFATDYLNFIETRFSLHKPIVPLPAAGLAKSGATQVVDLCSGAGGPVICIHQALLRDGISIPFTLTDKYPNVRAFRQLAGLYPEGIGFAGLAVDAAGVPGELQGFRTMFNGFHHFAPEAARAVLRCAVEAGQPVGIFEIPERSVATMLPLFLTPIFVTLATPFIRPFSWGRLLWTYLLPAVPLNCWWDGVVSQWRAYRVDEMLELTRDLDSYEWEAGRVSIAGTGTVTVAYTYVKSGVSCTSVYAAGTGTRQSRIFVYDSAGRLTSATNPENGTVNYTWNADNTLQKKVDAKGQTTTYSYDSAKRLTTVQTPDNCGTGKATYSYDTNPLNPAFSQYAQGRLTAVQYSVCLGPASAPYTQQVAELYSYHPAGGVTAKQVGLSWCGTDYYGNWGCTASNVEADYTYSTTGQVASYGSAFANGQNTSSLTFTYAFDSMARPIWLTDSTRRVWAQNGKYDFAGRPIYWRLRRYFTGGRYTTREPRHGTGADRWRR